MHNTQGMSPKTRVAVFTLMITGLLLLSACSGSGGPKPAVDIYPERGVVNAVITDETTKVPSCDEAAVVSVKLVNDGTVAFDGATITTAFDKTTVTVVVTGQSDLVSGIVYGDKGTVAFNFPKDTQSIRLDAEKDFKEVAPIKGVTLCGGGM